MTRTQSIIFFIVFGLLFLYLHSIQNAEGEITILCVMGLGVLFLLFPVAHFSKETEEMLSHPEDLENVNVERKASALVYYGDELHFTDEQLDRILTKHSPYYNGLFIGDKTKFLQRLKKFIAGKTFHIHDQSGFIEMPVLISAAAIQLSFGLDKFLLPNFYRIHIYPEEFIGVHPTLRILEGNVSGHSINLSWKHFLNGFKFPEDGQNTGLHEFAHAYYYQYFETGESVDKEFVAYYPQFSDHGNEALVKEQQAGNDLYTDYGLKNAEEFWAESVELFFEKPYRLKTSYPNLYATITQLLNQDPSNKIVKLN